MAAARLRPTAHPPAVLATRPTLRPDAPCARDAAAAAGKSRRSGGGGARRRPDAPGRAPANEDVEVFNISSGWNVNALSGPGAEDILRGLGAGWSVDSIDDDGAGGQTFTASITFEEDEDDDEFSDDEDEEEEFEVLVAEVKEREERAPRKQKGRGRVAERDLLGSLPEHLQRELAKQQAEADEEEARLRPEAQRKVAARQRTHRRLRIVAGTAAGIRILSPQGDQTRPMMEMVRGAVFSMIASLHGSPGGMPEGTRWLDLFAGTGAVGIEALSRGCDEAHFVELSPWVSSNCLQPNLEKCGVEGEAVVHTTRAEDFLKRAKTVPRFAGGAFDFISVCPPYEAVSYTELYELLEESPLLHEESVVVVEYPKKAVAEIRDNLGPLVKLRDRRYGRTLIAIYGPDDSDDDE